MFQSDEEFNLDLVHDDKNGYGRNNTAKSHNVLDTTTQNMRGILGTMGTDEEDVPATKKSIFDLDLDDEDEDESVLSLALEQTEREEGFKTSSPTPSEAPTLVLMSSTLPSSPPRSRPRPLAPSLPPPSTSSLSASSSFSRRKRMFPGPAGIIGEKDDKAGRRSSWAPTAADDENDKGGNSPNSSKVLSNISRPVSKSRV
jgi:hypothetical protein